MDKKIEIILLVNGFYFIYYCKIVESIWEGVVLFVIVEEGIDVICIIEVVMKSSEEKCIIILEY